MYTFAVDMNTVLQRLWYGCNMSALGERSVRIREVEGSNPFRSTTKSCEITYFTAFLQLFEKICVDANRAFPANYGDFREH